jgi:hypothetical protein
VAGYEDGGLDESDEWPRSSSRASGRLMGTLPCLLRERGLREMPEYCTSKSVLRSGIWTARLLLAVGLELDDDEGPAVAGMAAQLQNRLQWSPSAGRNLTLPQAGGMCSLKSGDEGDRRRVLGDKL